MQIKMGQPWVFYASIIATTLAALCILRLKPLPVTPPKRGEQIQTALYKQPFFRYIFLLSILSAIVSALAGFSFKAALLGQYSQNGLATFISIFNGSVSGLCLLIQLFVAGRLTIWVGLSAMLLILPASAVILGVSVAIWPVFFTFIALKGVYTVLHVNFQSPCMQIIINPFPSVLRKKISLLISGYGSAISGLIGAILIMIINQYLGLRFLGFVVVVLALWWLYVAYKSAKGYQDTLHKALMENRYNPDLLSLSPEAIVFMYKDILTSLNSGDTNVRITGLEFFEDETFVKHLPDHAQLEQAIIQSLSKPEKEIRYKAVMALKALSAISASDELVAQMEREQDEAVGWAILATLAHFAIYPRSEQALLYLNRNESFLIAYGLIALDLTEKIKLQDKVQEEINCLLNSNEKDRLLLAKASAYLSPTPEQSKLQQQLIQDESDEVSTQVIAAIEPECGQWSIPILLGFLNARKKAYFAETKLTDFKDQILEALLQVNLDTPRRQRQAMVRLLARLNQHDALAKLIELSKSPSITLRLSIAKKIRRFASYDLTQPANKEAMVAMIDWLAQEIRRLLSLETGDNEDLRHEINLQLLFNRRVFIIWFSLLTDRWRVATIEKYIEKPEQYLSTDVAKAYELLDNLSTDTSLRKDVDIIGQNYPQNQPIKKQANINPGLVLLAEHSYQFQEGIPMNKMDKAALLRRVKLFADVPVEVLLVIAEITREMDMAEGQYIFKDKDEPDRFYCIASGQVNIKKREHVLSELHEADYFGELGLLDNMPRTADAVAATDGALLYIEKEEFINVLEDLPEIMRAVVGQIIKYLRQNLERER